MREKIYLFKVSQNVLSFDDLNTVQCKSKAPV